MTAAEHITIPCGDDILTAGVVMRVCHSVQRVDGMSNGKDQNKPLSFWVVIILLATYTDSDNAL